MIENRKFYYPSNKGRVFHVRSFMDLDYLRIAMDLQKEDFLYLDPIHDVNYKFQNRYVLLDERVLTREKIDQVLSSDSIHMSTIFCFFFDMTQDIPEDLVDLSNEYTMPFHVYAEATVRKTFRKSVFFSSENGIWYPVRTRFRFPHLSSSLEEEFLRSISSSRDILKCYDRVEGIKIVSVD